MSSAALAIMLDFRENFSTRLVNSNCSHQHIFVLFCNFVSNFTGYSSCPNTGVFKNLKQKLKKFWVLKLYSYKVLVIEVSDFRKRVWYNQGNLNYVKGQNQKFSSELTFSRIFHESFKIKEKINLTLHQEMVRTKWEARLTTRRKVREEAKLEMTAPS